MEPGAGAGAGTGTDAGANAGAGAGAGAGTWAGAAATCVCAGAAGDDDGGTEDGATGATAGDFCSGAVCTFGRLAISGLRSATGALVLARLVPVTFVSTGLNRHLRSADQLTFLRLREAA